SKRTLGYDLVTLNRYVLRSVESFLVTSTGSAGELDRDGLRETFASRNYATEHDVSIQSRLPAARAVWKDLMADGETAALHAGAVARHRERIAALRASTEGRAVFEALTADGHHDAIFRGSLAAEKAAEPAE
ncbi:MAG: glycosyltransferase family 2 protein, partial [Silicimonas sp.]|nr:glycosyltransferase family 2 protein [Silicimonas sp.]